MDYKQIEKWLEEGKTWGELLDLGVTDTMRKKYYGWKDCLLDRKDSIDDDVLESIERREQALRVKQKSLAIERSINNEQIRDIAIHKTFSQQIIDSIKQLPTLSLEGDSYMHDNHSDEYIVTLSDLHYTGDRDELNVFNDVLEHLKLFVDVKDVGVLHIVELGDVIEGASLRNSQLMGVKSGMIQQTLEVAEAYSQFLTELSQYVNIKFYSVSSSNHTQLRSLGTKQNELVEEDLMQVFNQYITIRLPNLDITTGDDIVTEINDFTCFFSHGHLVKNKEGYLDKLSNSRNINIDFGFFGHYHHMRVIDLHEVKTHGKVYDKRAIYVPALTRQETNYERDRNLSSASGFAIFTVNEKYGITDIKKVIVE